jgi:hypothetical protein
MFFDAFPIEKTIGSQGTYHMPAFTAAEFDQFCRSVPGIEHHIHSTVLWQQVGDFNQHGPCYPVLAAKAQTIASITLSVEPTNGALSQIHLCVEGEPDWTNLNVCFNIHISITVDGFTECTLRVVVVEVYAFQMASVFVFLAQAVIYADHNRDIQPQLFAQPHELCQHVHSTWHSYRFGFPRTLAKEIRPRFRICFDYMFSV